MIHGFQLFILLPLKLFSSSPRAWKLYDEGVRYTKGAFATLMSESSCMMPAMRYMTTRTMY